MTKQEILNKRAESIKRYHSPRKEMTQEVKDFFNKVLRK